MTPPAAINPKGPRQVKLGADPVSWASSYLNTSVGSKILVACSGLALTAFLIVHMVGNLKIFDGPDALNSYAYFLKHELGAYLWAARIGLLALFLAHVVLALKLSARSRQARPIRYISQQSAQASLASRSMLYTGIVILAFVILHLAHFTFGWVHEYRYADGTTVNYLDKLDEHGRHDVYSMVIAGFTTPWLAVTYLICQLLIGIHLSHGIQSTIQTLGLKSVRFAPAWTWLGYAVALTIVLGNCAIVLAVWTGVVPAGSAPVQ
jgi:succinate dehydrogenase / fumarate reductase cytochrome b subunit